VPPDPGRIAHFRIVGRLGEGGMGVVYRAEDEKLRRTVALKLLRPSHDDEDRRRRFLREARSAASIAHPNIAAVYEVGEDDGVGFIAMELIEGETLRARLARGRMEVGAALSIARAVLAGLVRAHERGIVHRDLKPDNVMIDRDGHVKILDFGLAKLRVDADPSSPIARTESVAPTTEEGRLLGTPEYMSPEQAEGHAVDERADVFAFGVLLYEMLTGERPFRGRSSMQVIASILRDVPAPLRSIAPAVPTDIEAVVTKCLAKTPADRWPSARAVLGAIDAATPHGRARVSRARRSAAAIGVVALIGAAVWLAARGSGGATRAPIASAEPEVVPGTIAPQMASTSLASTTTPTSTSTSTPTSTSTSIAPAPSAAIARRQAVGSAAHIATSAAVVTSAPTASNGHVWDER
jgi:serine/threonine-protein kinase